MEDRKQRPKKYSSLEKGKSIVLPPLNRPFHQQALQQHRVQPIRHNQKISFVPISNISAPEKYQRHDQANKAQQYLHILTKQMAPLQEKSRQIEYNCRRLRQIMLHQYQAYKESLRKNEPQRIQETLKTFYDYACAEELKQRKQFENLRADISRRYYERSQITLALLRQRQKEQEQR